MEEMDCCSSGKFTWTINYLSKVRAKKLYSNVFLVGGYKWRILIFPKGNNVKCMSVYLDVADSGSLPHGWKRNTMFSLAVIDQLDSENTITKYTEHEFTAHESDWGFSSFIPLSDLNNPSSGYVVNDTCIVEANVHVKLSKGEDKKEEEAEPNDCTSVKGNSVEAQEKQSTTLVDVPREQSLPLASASIETEEQSELKPDLAETIARPQAEPDPINNSLRETGETEKPVAGNAQEETKMATILCTPLVDQDLTLVEAGKGSSFVADFNTLLSDIQTLLNGNTSDGAETSTSFTPPQLTDKNIAQAKQTFKECINMKIANIFQQDRALELKNSLSIMLSSNAFQSNKVQEMTKFLANFDESHELFMAAQRDLQLAQQKENSMDELKAGLKQFSLEFVPIRNQVNAVDREVAKLEAQLAERKAKKAQLRNSLEDLAARATASRQALIEAVQDVRLFTDRKERAEETIGDMESLWESLNN